MSASCSHFQNLVIFHEPYFFADSAVYAADAGLKVGALVAAVCVVGFFHQLEVGKPVAVNRVVEFVFARGKKCDRRDLYACVR